MDIMDINLKQIKEEPGQNPVPVADSLETLDPYTHYSRNSQRV